jgi:hypothetical protein
VVSSHALDSKACRSNQASFNCSRELRDLWQQLQQEQECTAAAAAAGEQQQQQAVMCATLLQCAGFASGRQSLSSVCVPVQTFVTRVGYFEQFEQWNDCRVSSWCLGSCCRPGRDDGYDDDRYGEYHRYGGPGGAPYRGPSDYDEPRPGAGRYSGPPGPEDEFDFRGGRGGGGERDWTGPSGSGWREREAYYHREGGRGSSSYDRGSSGYDRFAGGPEGAAAAAAGRYTGERPGAAGYDSYTDRDLLPPPPPPRGGLGPAGSVPEAAGSLGAGAIEARVAESDEERDLEREEFEAELARVAAELERVSGAGFGWLGGGSLYIHAGAGKSAVGARFRLVRAHWLAQCW